MKRARRRALPKPPKKRDPVAVSPLLRKGGAHGKTTGAKRRQEKLALSRALRAPDSGE
jgi:hypothetical protein